MPLIAKSPETAETITPTTTGRTRLESIPASNAAGASSIAEPKIGGIDIRNANLTAHSLLSPQARPPTRVLPDLDIPALLQLPAKDPL